MCECPPHLHACDGILLSTVQDDGDEEVMRLIGDAYLVSLQLSHVVRDAVRARMAAGKGVVVATALRRTAKVNTRNIEWKVYSVEGYEKAVRGDSTLPKSKFKTHFAVRIILEFGQHSIYPVSEILEIKK